MKKLIVTRMANLSKFMLFLLILGVFSCKKYLDKKSDNSLIVPTSIEDLQALLDNTQLMNLRMTPCLGEVSSDDYFLLADTYKSLIETERNVYTWYPEPLNFQNDWSYSYTAVYNSNLCLELIDKIPITSINELAWKNVKGSALFYRAFNFLNLLWIYSKAYDETTSDADLGIVLRLTSDFNKPSARANVADSYAQVIKDAKAALQYLPNDPLVVFRPSGPAANGLLARTYLSMRQYDSAYKYSDLYLQKKNQLLDFNDASKVLSSSGNPFQSVSYGLNPEIIFYTEMNQIVSTPNPIFAKIDTSLFATFSADDWRREVYFTPNSGYQQFKGNYTANEYLFFSGIATDEMYLTRAECYARAGDTFNALGDLNTLLIKRWKDGLFVPLTSTSVQEVLENVLLERRKELMMRGIRWMDIKRFNKEGAEITLTRHIDNETFRVNPNSNIYALPIPQDIINITGISQNPQ